MPVAAGGAPQVPTDAAPAGLRLRVAMVSPGFPPDAGGIEKVVGHLFDSLGTHHTVDVFAHAPAKQGRRGPAVIGVQRFREYTCSERFGIAPGLWSELRRTGHQYDVIHAHNFHASPALAAALMTSTPLIFSPHFHGGGHTRAARALHRPYGRIAQTIFSRAARVLCVSHAEKTLLLGAYPSVADRVVVIPNGVDGAELRESTPFESERPVVLVAGRLEEYKQVALAIRSLMHLRPSVQMVISGDGADRLRLQQVAVETGVSSRVTFLGHVPTPTLCRWQRTAAVTLSLSRHEAFGLGVLEAGISGSGVVASAIPAHLELAPSIGSFTEFVPTSASPATVANAISRALAHRTAPRDLGWPNWVDVAAATANVYAEVFSESVNNGGGRRASRNSN